MVDAPAVTGVTDAVVPDKSLIGVDGTVLGTDVVADLLEYNGNILDVCIGSCNDAGLDPTDPDGDGDGDGDGNGGGGTGSNPGSGTNPDGTDGTGGPILTDSTGAIMPGAVINATGKPGLTPVDVVGPGTGDPCGDDDVVRTIADGSIGDGNPGPNFAFSNAGLNLPDQEVLACSARDNAQVFNGFDVIDMEGEIIGTIHDAFLTPELKIRRIQFAGLDDRCFGLSNGEYTVVDATVTVNIPASFLVQPEK